MRDLTQKSDLVLVRKLKATKKNTKFFLGADFLVGDFVVPKDFSTDLVSVPIGLRNIVSRVDGIEAAVLHDYLYSTKETTRKEADNIFLALLKNLVPSWKSRLMFWAVRLGGSFIWKD